MLDLLITARRNSKLVAMTKPCKLDALRSWRTCARSDLSAMVRPRDPHLRHLLTLYVEKPHLRIRDGKEVLATNHHSDRTDITPDMDPDLLFTGDGACLLTPEVTEGPYWIQGELVRKDVTDGQEGVKLTLDIQVIDTKTCEPVPEVRIVHSKVLEAESS
jgi:hypothetical protein